MAVRGFLCIIIISIFGCSGLRKTHTSVLENDLYATRPKDVKSVRPGLAIIGEDTLLVFLIVNHTQDTKKIWIFSSEEDFFSKKNSYVLRTETETYGYRHGMTVLPLIKDWIDFIDVAFFRLEKEK